MIGTDSEIDEACYVQISETFEVEVSMAHNGKQCFELRPMHRPHSHRPKLDLNQIQQRRAIMKSC